MKKSSHLDPWPGAALSLWPGPQGGAEPSVRRGHSQVGCLLGPAEQREGQDWEGWSPEQGRAYRGPGRVGWAGVGLAQNMALSGGLLLGREESSCNQSRNTGCGPAPWVPWACLVPIPSVLPWAQDLGSGAQKPRALAVVYSGHLCVITLPLYSSGSCMAPICPSARVGTPSPDPLPPSAGPGSVGTDRGLGWGALPSRPSQWSMLGGV